VIWQFINSGANTGKFNMDFDIHLAENLPADTACFRLYKWKPYCISLGHNQKFEDINLAKAEVDNIDVVKRPTGGRAILHAEEITYSVVHPLNGTITPIEIYRKISLALAKGLSIYDEKLTDTDLENVQPNFLELLKESKGIACFASTAKSEVKYKGKKLIGSAQRKMNNVILQHGSILTGNYHLKIAEYLNLPGKEIDIINSYLLEKTIDIEQILGKKTDYDKLMLSLKKGFEKEWQINFVEKEYEVNE